MGNKTKTIIILLFIIIASTQAQLPKHYWYFGANCGMQLDNDGNILSTKVPSKINTEEGSATIDINENLSLYSDGITVWDNNGNIVLDKLSSNKSCTQAAMFMPRVASGRIKYVDVISLINFARPEGASISRIYFDDNGNYSTRKEMTNVKFTKNYLVEEKMAGIVNCLKDGKLFNVLILKVNASNKYLITTIGKDENKFDLETNEQSIGVVTSDSHLNTTSYLFDEVLGINGENNNYHAIVVFSPADGLVQHFNFNKKTFQLEYHNKFSPDTTNQVRLPQLINAYSGIRYGRDLYFTNTSSTLYRIKYFFYLQNISDYNYYTTNIDTFDFGKAGYKGISLGALANNNPYNHTNSSILITAYDSNFVFKYWISNTDNQFYNIDKYAKVSLDGICKYGFPTITDNLHSDCYELMDYNLLGDAIQTDDTIKVSKLKNNSCGGISFQEKLNIKEVLNLSFNFKIDKGDNNKILDGSEPGADGFSIVFSKEKPTTCLSAGNLGYAGLQNAFAIEMDLYKNYDYGDPNGNHLCIKTPDQNGILTPIHNSNDLYLTSSGTIFSNGGTYNMNLSLNVPNGNTIAVDSIDKRKNQSTYYAFTKQNLIDYINQYVKSDTFYITCFASTGDAIEEHNFFDFRLCRNLTNTKVSSGIADEEKPEAIVFDKTEKIIVTSLELKQILSNSIRNNPNYKICNIDGKEIDIKDLENNNIKHGMILFLIDYQEFKNNKALLIME